MKLKNKKTGEIIDDGYVRETYDFQFDGQKHVLAVFKGNGHRPPERVSGAYTSIAELNAEWEDYEEPIQVYIEGIQNVFMSGGRVYIDYATAKEAELAVRKLKAWERLKDKGFRFKNWDLDADDEDINVLLSSDTYKGSKVYDFEKDLDLLFGGEE